MKTTQKILLVGAGKFGINHLRVLKNIEKQGHINLLGVVVRDPKKYQKTAKDFDVNFYKELSKDLLKKADAVIIATPVESHYEIAKKCLPHCHVFLEKPVTETLEQAKKLRLLSKKYKHALVVGHIFRFHEVTKKLKDLLSKDRKPKQIRGSFINPFDSHNDREQTLEFLHLFDIVDHIWEENPHSIHSQLDDKVVKVNVRYKDGYDSHFVLGWKDKEKIRNLSFFFEDEIFEADFIKNNIVVRNSADKKTRIEHIVEIKQETLYEELMDFLQNISKGKRAVSNIDMAIRVLSLAIKAVPKRHKKPNVAIIGGGIFGLSIAEKLGEACDVTVFERNSSLMNEGSLVNQFRHHYGYHYPRSDDTVIEIKDSRQDFEEMFKKAIVLNYPTYYGLSKNGSKVNVEEFIKFCNKHSLPYTKEFPPENILARNEISLSIKVPEPSYNHKTLTKIARDRLAAFENVKIKTNTTVTDCILNTDGSKLLKYETRIGEDKKNIKKYKKEYDFVINATYANINRFINWLKFEPCSIRVDLAEVLIVKLPIKPISLTIIDGEFATLMPTGNPNEFTLYHVKESIIDRYVPIDGLVKTIKKHKSNKEAIFKESLKFFPILEKAEIIESRIVHRGVRANREHDDSRVADLIEHGFGCWSVLSGKILSSSKIAKNISSVIKRYL